MKLENSPAFEAIKDADLKLIFELFKSNGYEIRIAGGAVRDLLTGKVPEDVDLATTATPDQMKAMFTREHVRMINSNGEKHGTVTVRVNDRVNFEITTLRVDVLTDGRHAEVMFTHDWQLDANRRDLTVNSIFLDEDGTIVDFFNGYEDLKNHRIRFVGDANVRIQEDYLRILRYFRFYPRVCLDENSHDQAALEAIRANAHGLKGIAGERIWVELKKLVCSRFAASLVSRMQETGVLRNIGFPDACNLDEFARVYGNFHDNLEHIPASITMICALLNNPHEFETLHKRIKFSNDEKKLAEVIFKHRDEFKSDREEENSNKNKKQKSEQDETLKKFKCILVDTSKDSKDRAKSRVIELLKYVNRRELIEDIESWPVPDFPIRGDVLVERNIPKGPLYSRVLDALKRAWMYEFDMDTSPTTVDKLLAKCDQLINNPTFT